jgi:peptidoglycan-N-acetylglucosamine deacetylase
MMRRAVLAALCLFGVVGCVARPNLWLFTAPWDTRSDSSLASGVAPRATVVSGWISLDSAGGVPVSLFEDPPRSLSERRSERFALITSYRVDKFHQEAVRALSRDVAARQRAADAVESMVRAGSYAGVVLDLEALEPGDTTALAVVVGSLSAAARRGGAREIAIAVPALDTLAYAPRVLLPHVDRLLVMLYDQHWLGSEPGPVAARSWARAALQLWVTSAGAGRVVAALPVYGYHWRSDAPTDVVGWGDMQRLARESGAMPARDSASGSLRLQMGARGEAWLADGPLLAHMAEDARALGVRTLALWRLGLEDPAVWTALGVR